MSTFKKSTAGFTLIELMIVVIIVAVLAAVGIPLLQGNVERAKLTEAVAGLGTLRTAIRAKIAELGAIPGTDIVRADDPTTLRDMFGLKEGDLTGRYFEDNDYGYDFRQQAAPAQVGPPVVAALPAQYCLTVEGNVSANGPAGALAAKRSQVSNLNRSMNENGDIFTTANCSGTAIN